MPDLDTIALKPDEACYAFEVQLVRIVKRMKVYAVGIENAPDRTLLDQRDHDLRTGKTAARDMTRKGFDVGHYEGLCLRPTGPADASALADTRTGNGSLKRTQHQLILFDEVESYPQPSELLLKCARYVSQVCDEV